MVPNSAHQKRCNSNAHKRPVATTIGWRWHMHKYWEFEVWGSCCTYTVCWWCDSLSHQCLGNWEAWRGNAQWIDSSCRSRPTSFERVEIYAENGWSNAPKNLVLCSWFQELQCSTQPTRHEMKRYYYNRDLQWIPEPLQKRLVTQLNRYGRQRQPLLMLSAQGSYIHYGRSMTLVVSMTIGRWLSYDLQVMVISQGKATPENPRSSRGTSVWFSVICIYIYNLHLPLKGNRESDSHFWFCISSWP